MLYDQIQETKQFITDKINRKPEIAIILGSGLGGLVDLMEDRETIDYKDIPNFPKSNLVGHVDRLVFGKIAGKECVAMQGRFHYYEGHSMKELTFPTYVLSALGVKTLIVTNACGGVNTTFIPGDLMLITDHISLFAPNPLIGENDDRLGPRFPDMSEIYKKDLIQKAVEVADANNIKYQKGVYCLFTGPTYETAAEIRAFKALGADAVGMSTVPEAIVANYLGLNVLGIACITNMATGIATSAHSHASVVETAQKAGDTLTKWVKLIIEEI